MSDDGAGGSVDFEDGSAIRASYIERVVGWFRHGTARIVGHREALGQGGVKKMIPESLSRGTEGIC